MEQPRLPRNPGRGVPETGDFGSAVKWQTKANELGGDDEDKTVGESRLSFIARIRPTSKPGLDLAAIPLETSQRPQKSQHLRCGQWLAFILLATAQFFSAATIPSSLTSP